MMGKEALIPEFHRFQRIPSTKHVTLPQDQNTLFRGNRDEEFGSAAENKCETMWWFKKNTD